MTFVRLVVSRALALGIGGMLAIGCGGGTTPISPTPIAGAPATAAQLAGMTEAIQDEYKSEATYAKVIADFGVVVPFATIVASERAHIASVADLFVSRSLAVPASSWNASNVPVFATFREACAGAAAGERENVALYDRLITADLPRDLLLVYTRLRSASLNNHLPAFESCS